MRIRLIAAVAAILAPCAVAQTPTQTPTPAVPAPPIGDYECIRAITDAMVGTWDTTRHRRDGEILGTTEAQVTTTRGRNPGEYLYTFAIRGGPTLSATSILTPRGTLDTVRDGAGALLDTATPLELVQCSASPENGWRGATTRYNALVEGAPAEVLQEVQVTDGAYVIASSVKRRGDWRWLETVVATRRSR